MHYKNVKDPISTILKSMLLIPCIVPRNGMEFCTIPKERLLGTVPSLRFVLTRNIAPKPPFLRNGTFPEAFMIPCPSNILSSHKPFVIVDGRLFCTTQATFVKHSFPL
ncbi:hypothetical protein O6H91_12G092500 [Diphasiastrum complanatum]|uniref:Uncharacterized protein n=1 Tax=Diphasiastrum complanatum TaxID=34168 RepID=A0ACC2C4R7_DIPCM|nr:hypothetical protein O6H91_12G092500 [Diphasiastrum complanatum]